MKKLLVLIVAVLVLGAIYVYVLPLVGIDTAVNPSDPYKQMIKERDIRTAGMSAEEKILATATRSEVKSDTEEVPVQTSLVVTGQLIGANSHKAKGSVDVASIGGGYGIAYKDFSFDAGSSLRVYLTNNIVVNPATSVDLGPVTKTSGTAFYGVPPGTDIKKYKYIVVWSVDKKELFNYAELSTK